jgi:hypothetical protein
MEIMYEYTKCKEGQCVAGVAVHGREELSTLMPSILDKAFKGEL